MFSDITPRSVELNYTFGRIYAKQSKKQLYAPYSGAKKQKNIASFPLAMLKFYLMIFYKFSGFLVIPKAIITARSVS